MTRSWLRWSGASALLALLLVAACRPSDERVPGTRTATPAGSPSPTAAELTVAGLFSDPRPSDPDRTVPLRSRPPTPFRMAASGEVVLYDVAGEASTSLGTGQLGIFNETETLFAWIARGGGSSAPPELRVVDLWGQSVFDLGPAGTIVQFENDQAVRIANWEGDGESIVDLVRGARLDAEPAVYRLDGAPFRLAEVPDSGGLSRFTLWDGGTPLLQVDAIGAVVADDETVAALIPSDAGHGNVFLIDVATRQARFVATTEVGPERVPLLANERWVVWTPDFCGAFGARPAVGPGTRVYDRDTGALIALDGASLWPAAFASETELLVGLNGGDAILDLEAVDWRVVLPEPPGGITWSSGYRFAASGPVLGGASPCD